MLTRIFFLIPVLLLSTSASAALTADELVLIVNGNIPASVKSAEFYAQARQVPAGRIIKLNLPAGEEIPFAKYEQEVVPLIRAFLRDNGLETKVRCAVTFFGVPIRIGSKQLTAAETAEVAALKAELGEVARQIVPLIREVERTAAQLDPSFAPRVGEDPGDLTARADHALGAVARRMPPANDPRHKELLPQLVKLTRAFGGDAQVADKLSDRDIGLMLGAEEAKRWPARRGEIAAAHQEIAALHDRRYDPAARQRVREIMKRDFGLFGRLESVQAQIEYLGTDGTVSAFDSELACLWWRYYNRGRWQVNPLHARINLHGQPPPRTLMVTRLDGPQEGTASEIVLASLKAERDGLQGRIVIDSMGGVGPDGKPDKEGGYRSFDDKLLRLAELVASKSKMPLVLDKKHPVLPPHSVKDVALYCGWYSVRNYVPACEFKAGAVGYHVASFEMISLRSDNEKGWVAGMLNDGAAATLGAVAEPYLSAMPSPDDFFPLLMTGKLTLAEVYWKTVPMTSWMMSFIGDPLYTPFKTNPQLQPSDLSPVLQRAFASDAKGASSAATRSRAATVETPPPAP